MRAVVLFVLLLAGGAGCSRGGESNEAAGQTIAVTVQAARIGSLRDLVAATGSVVPTAVGDFLVTSNGPAEIVEVTKNEGDQVKAGDVLVRLEVASVTNELSTRQLELTEATTKLEAAKSEEVKLESLVNQGFAARSKLEAARTARLAAETAVNQIKVRFDAAKALEGTTVIRARFAGTVIKRWKMPGEMTAGGETDPIMRVIDPARLQVALQVPRAQAERINQGQPATVQTGTGTEPAIVAMKGMAAGETAPTVEIRLNLASATPLALDTMVQAEIVLEELQNVLVIPAGAVQVGEKGPFVWLATNEGTAVKRDIRVGLTATGLTHVASGLAAGDQVITTGIAQLTEGIAVTISK